MSISTPTSGQNVTDPAQGKGLTCAGNWTETTSETDSHGATHTHRTPHKNENLTVLLQQPGAADQRHTVRTNTAGDWSTKFSSCRPGPATISTFSSGGVDVDDPV